MKFEDFFEKQLKKDKKLREVNENKDFQFYCDVANLITEARLHAGLTQSQLAKKVGTKQPSVARIEKGSGLPSLSFLLKIAHALNTHLVAPKFGFMEQSDSFFGYEVAINQSQKIKEIPSDYYDHKQLKDMTSYVIC